MFGEVELIANVGLRLNVFFKSFLNVSVSMKVAHISYSTIFPFLEHSGQVRTQDV